MFFIPLRVQCHAKVLVVPIAHDTGNLRDHVCDCWVLLLFRKVPFSRWTQVKMRATGKYFQMKP